MATALCSSLYMRKRLPQPKARIETFAPVRPSVRDGRAADFAPASSFNSSRLVPAAVPISINSLREISLLMAHSSRRFAWNLTTAACDSEKDCLEIHDY